MSGGLITSLMLNEEYVVHVLGFERSTLNEGRYNMGMQQEILHAHLLAENWLKQGFKDLKKAGVKGWEAVKDKALEVPNAIKDFGNNINGLVAGLTAMVNDPEEAKAYSVGIMGQVRLWPKKLNKSLKTIQKWLEDHNMPTFAKGVGKIRDLIIELWKSVQNVSGWMKSISMLAFGLLIKYVEEEFGILEKTRKVTKILADPMELVKDFGGAVADAGEEVLDDVKDFFAGKITDLAKDSDLYKKIAGFLEEKLGFVQEIKKKFIDIGTQIAGSVVSQFAGPIAWIKQLVDLFKSSSWVVGNLNKMLVRMSF